MNRKLLKQTWMVAVLLMMLPTMMMAQTDKVRRRPSSSGTIQHAQPKTQKTTKKTQTQTSSRPAGPRHSFSSERTTVNGSNAERFTVDGVTFTMVAVQGGTFTMGATSEQGSDAYSDEKPAHRVTLSNYYIGQTEVTQALWQAVMGSNPSKWKGSNLPVEQVSWNDCQQFITKLNQLTGRKFRLPTEAEWEYAARGGNKSRGYKYAGSNDICSVAWYSDNSGKKTHPVGQKQANELGIYDMSGNVLELCQDWYDKGYYSKSPSNNPCNNISYSNRVGRGGGWGRDAWCCRVAARYSYAPFGSYDFLGLRLAL
jgi:formylglycine-generating enzyme required for sulfatase activity